MEVGLNGSHMVGSHHVLFEGNESFNYDSDNTHGNAIAMTVFRNHLVGRRKSFTGMVNGRTAGLMFGSWWHTFIGNVFGEPGRMEGWVYDDPGDGTGGHSTSKWGSAPAIWRLGYDPTHWEQAADPKVKATVVRDGNFDFLTGQVRWDRAAQALPNSLYLRSKPAFFGTTRGLGSIRSAARRSGYCPRSYVSASVSRSSRRKARATCGRASRGPIEGRHAATSQADFAGRAAT